MIDYLLCCVLIYWGLYHRQRMYSYGGHTGPKHICLLSWWSCWLISVTFASDGIQLSRNLDLFVWILDTEWKFFCRCGVCWEEHYITKMSLMLNVMASLGKGLSDKVITWDENTICVEIKVKCHVCHIPWSLNKFKMILGLLLIGGVRQYQMFLGKPGRISTESRSKLRNKNAFQ